MSFIGDAMKTIESVIMLRSKVGQLDAALHRTNDDVREIVRMVLQIDRRLIRLEAIEEVRHGPSPLPRIEP